MGAFSPKAYPAARVPEARISDPNGGLPGTSTNQRHRLKLPWKNTHVTVAAMWLLRHYNVPGNA